jgi:hypothetical protein
LGFFPAAKGKKQKIKTEQEDEELADDPPPPLQNQQPNPQHKSSRKTADSDTHLSDFKFQAV